MIPHSVRGNTVDFGDPDAARALTKCLLRRDFGLDIDIPADRLCPPVPNRLNYLLWIEDLVAETFPRYAVSSSSPSPEDEATGDAVVGIDIGTGSTAIYPLLACSRNPSWRFLALESDPTSFASARSNVERNDGGQGRIDLLSADAETGAVLMQHQAIADPSFRATFTMCNPPFYDSREDMERSESLKADAAAGACTGSQAEMITPGGEVAFTQLQLAESRSPVLRDRVQWYSTMLGKLSSVERLVADLKRAGVTNHAVTEFRQGKTRRWGLAWSFLPWRPLPETARSGAAPSLQDLGPVNPVLRLDLPESFHDDDDDDHAGGRVFRILETFMAESRLDWAWITVKQSIDVFIEENTWSRQARRRQAKLAAAAAAAAALGQSEAADEQTRKSTSISEEKQWSTGIQVTYHSATNAVTLRWRCGFDFVLFESFCGKVKQLLR